MPRHLVYPYPSWFTGKMLKMSKFLIIFLILTDLLLKLVAITIARLIIMVETAIGGLNQ